MDNEGNNIIYGLDDVPPPGALLLLSFQQMMLLFTAATFPALLVREVGGSVEIASSMVPVIFVPICAVPPTWGFPCRRPGTGASPSCTA
jgi:hypothetical protein